MNRSLLITPWTLTLMIVALATAGVFASPRQWYWLCAGGCLVLIVAGLRRRIRARADGDTFAPAGAPPPDRTTRMTEAAILGIMALGVLLIAATSQSNHGMLLNLDLLFPAAARAHVGVAAGALIGVLISVFITTRGRTVLGTVCAAIVLTAYGLILNGPGELIHAMASHEDSRPIARYTINISGCGVRGADLWVNDVYLGKTPYATTLDEFTKKVPYWPEPPKGLTDKTDSVQVPQYGAPRTYYRSEPTWIEFKLPRRPEPRRDRHKRRRATRGRSGEGEQLKYYARVKYAGEWGYYGGGRGGGGGGGGYRYHAHTHFNVVFPARQARLESLLNQARLKDYRVDSAWFEAIETYGADGWLALRKAADAEPEMMQVLDQWAIWKHDLSKAVDADSAWSALERIRNEAEDRQMYITADPMGRAVELLIKALKDEDRSVRGLAVECLALLSWSAAARRLKGRDEWIGWSEE